MGTVDRRLRIERNVVLYTPHYLVAPWILASTDLVAALPERIAARFCQAFALTVRPLPIAADSLKVHQLWHPLRHDEPAHRWLRGAVLSAAKSPISTRARAFKSQAGPV